MIMARLLHLSARAGTWLAPHTHNFRNVSMDRVDIQIGDPSRFRLPRTGWLQLDYLQYSAFLLAPSALEPNGDDLYRSSPATARALASGLRIARPCHLQSLTALLRAFLRARDAQQAEAWQRQQSLLCDAGKHTKGLSTKQGKAARQNGAVLAAPDASHGPQVTSTTCYNLHLETPL